MTDDEIKQTFRNLGIALAADDDGKSAAIALTLLEELLLCMKQIADAMTEIAENTVP